jgi:iron complex transport system substrate-binding protein
VVYRNAAFADVPAVREGRVVCIPEAFMGRPGPRLVDGSRALREVVAGWRSDVAQTRA